MQNIPKLFEHLNWANLRILERLRSGEAGSHPKAVGLFAHILQAERIWLTRLQGKDSSALTVWPEADLDFCGRMAEQNHEDYTAYLAGLTAAEWDRVFRYTNQSGKVFDNSVGDILTHVALHGQYHRGQINALLRADGAEPVNVDFITFVREKNDV
ncbi:DinB family protein [Paenibacillus tyrfis]|uniref:Damage-inducible protein DinB n=1 Tax=Paenibacillus tyrfis TaxID=1501230 RepID=A0A081P370_9BACL|nr:DinB family protein [Paenibacillus tyrfis]KEQ25143.1 damage-inducible protein DinB [Paenibacillus tyrfis]